MGKLSNKPSKILLQALQDLEAVEKIKGVKINMSDWVVGKFDANSNACEVCHAGATMINRLGCSINDSHSPYDIRFDQATQSKLQFINYVREGQISEGLRDLNLGGVITYKQLTSVLKNFEVEGVQDIQDDYSYGDPERVNVPLKVREYKGVKAKRQYKEYILLVAGILKAEGL